MQYNNIIFEKISPKIAKITLNHPDNHNALTKYMLNDLNHCLDMLKKDKELVVLILKANGKHFCAGGDLAAFVDPDQVAARKQINNLVTLFSNLYNLPAIVICQPHGAVYGGALGLVAASDLVLAADNSKFCFSEVKIGVVPAIISPYVVNTIGARKSKELTLTGRVFDAKYALDIEFINNVYSNAELDTKTEQLAAEIANNAPDAVRRAKKIFNYDAGITPEIIETTELTLNEVRQGTEAKHGIDCFFNKTKPDWTKTD